MRHLLALSSASQLPTNDISMNNTAYASFATYQPYSSCSNRTLRETSCLHRANNNTPCLGKLWLWTLMPSFAFLGDLGHGLSNMNKCVIAKSSMKKISQTFLEQVSFPHSYWHSKWLVAGSLYQSLIQQHWRCLAFVLFIQDCWSRQLVRISKLRGLDWSWRMICWIMFCGHISPVMSAVADEWRLKVGPKMQAASDAGELY